MSHLVVVTQLPCSFEGSFSALAKVLFESNLGWRGVIRCWSGGKPAAMPKI